MNVDEVRVLLLEVLDHEMSDASTDLRVQATSIASVSGFPTMIDIVVSDDAACADIEDGPLPVMPVVVNDSGDQVGELLIWVSEGRLSAVEFAWWTDSQPTSLPGVSQLRF